jgi:4-amino-4-deoxy-L-arabinose transferase-like glycosyltransferase
VIARGERMLLAPSPRVFALCACVATLLLSLYFGWQLLGWQPAVGDEFALRWQALLLSSGRLFARSELNSEFFSTIETLDVDGRWFAQFPFGWPAMLSVGVRFGVPWLINPLFAGLGAIGVYQFVRGIDDELTARVTTLLFALSPFVLFMAGSQMTHTAALAFLWLALSAVPRWRAADNRASAYRAAALIGLGVGLAASIRPFDAVVVAVVVGAFQVRIAMRNRWLAPSIALQCAVALIPVVLVLAANRATTGAVLPLAYDVLNGPEHRPGFHLTPLGFVHTPYRGVYIVSSYLMKLDVGLLGWPVPAMVLVVVSLALMRRATVWDRLLLAILGGMLLGYLSYWSESSFFGPRFLITVAPIFLLYIARLPRALRERIKSPIERTAVALLIPIWIIIAWDTPAKEGRLYGVHELARLYNMHAQSGPPIVEAVARAGITKAVIFIPEGWHARLTARLRALGMRPLIAEQIVSQEDACTLQQYLDATDQLPASVSRDDRQRIVVQGTEKTIAGRKLADQQPSDQLSLVPERQLTAICLDEFARTTSLGVSLAEMLPHQEIGPNGELTGVVYARDFGARNERLKSRFGDRPWYVANVSGVPRSLVVKLVQLR